MVASWEDRLQFRLIERWLLPAALFGGAALAPGTITGDSGRMLVIFLGLVSASVLPTISLLVGSMSAAGRSVLAINELDAEIQSAMNALFFLFACVAIVVGALVALASPPPQLLSRIPLVTSELLPRSGQAIVIVFSALILTRLGQIPAILRRTLAVRHQIALDEARRKTMENAPVPGSSQATFTPHPDFGKSVAIEEASGPRH
jgi:hypothetical protein